MAGVSTKLDRKFPCDGLGCDNGLIGWKRPGEGIALDNVSPKISQQRYLALCFGTFHDNDPAKGLTE